MANLGGVFDANTVQPNQPFEVIPAGDYCAHIVSSSMENTKNNDGQFLKLELEILDGAQAGRKTFDRLNLVNRNAQAQEIAQRTLSSICHAVNKLSIQDSEELHMLPFMVKIAVKPRADKPGELSNEIKGYKACGGSAVVAPQQQAAFKPAAPATASTPPWKRAANA